jgi:DNA-binding transcriptional MerR regulator
MAPQPAEDWRERFRQIHQQKGLVQAIQYLRETGISPSEIRVFLEQEKAAGRIPRRPEQSSGNVV